MSDVKTDKKPPYALIGLSASVTGDGWSNFFI